MVGELAAAGIGCPLHIQETAMTVKLPPVPPAERDDPLPAEKQENETKSKTKTKPENTEDQGHAGNIHQNTTNQGYQQNR